MSPDTVRPDVTAVHRGEPAAAAVRSCSPPAPNGTQRGRVVPMAVRAALVVALVGAVGCGQDDDQAASDRQAEVAERGASVMPFDLDATTHRFEPRDDGLLQTVVADDPDDDEQVTLVREHLTEEVERFAEGDFRDPASIHGDDMPGLAALSAGADRIDVTYADVSAGAAIAFITDDVELVDALHDWGEAQVSDHGSHAEHDDGDDMDGAG